MILSLYIFLEVVAIVLFLIAFFLKQEVIWAMALVVLSVLMMSAFSIESYVYEFNETLGAYYPKVQTISHPYFMGVNMLFFVVALLLALYDIYEKYGVKSIASGLDKTVQKDFNKLK